MAGPPTTTTSRTRGPPRTRDINATNVAKLKPAWRFKLPYVGQFGAYASNPIVLNGVVYIQDPDSDVYALNQQTGAVMWKHLYKSPTPSGGPNGLALGYGKLFGATEASAFALDAKTGKQLWMHKLTNNKNEGIDMAPQLYDNKVLMSTIPGSATNFYHPGALGIVYSLNADTGKTIWKFNTIKGGYKLFGHPEVNSGGGLWYPPSVDSTGRVYMGVANPAPYPGTPKFPNGSSHPGANLYTDSLVALDGATGKIDWFQQVTPHDFRDYDFQVAPIVRSQMINGTMTETVIGAGKSGKVVAFRADNGKRLWTRNVGVHKFDSGPFPLKKAVCYEPGFLGGVETPMAASGNLVYVPFVNLCFDATATGIKSAGGFNGGTGGLAAIDSATGKIVWQKSLPSPAYGAATVANDVVFTATLAGKIYAFDTKTGNALSTMTGPAGINSFPAVTKNMLIIGAGASSPSIKKPQNEIVAYSLNAPAGGAKTQSAPSASPTSSGSAAILRDRDGRLGPGQGRGVLLPALDQVGREARQGDVRLQEHRPRTARLQDRRQADAAAPAGQDGQAGRDLQEEGQVLLPLHRARACRSGHEGHVHGSLAVSSSTTGPPLRFAAAGLSVYRDLLQGQSGECRPWSLAPQFGHM